VRFATKTIIGVADEEVIPPVVGTAVAVRVSGPRRDGFQLQTAIMFGDVPEVRTLRQPGMRRLLALKVTFAATETFAFI
jgi:hypothetical protein